MSSSRSVRWKEEHDNGEPSNVIVSTEISDHGVASTSSSSMSSTATTNSDVSKLNMKNQLEEEMRLLVDYYAQDVTEYPGWAFLLGAVVNAYGICPYLNVKDKDNRTRRATWLSNQHDQGHLYYDAVYRLSDQQLLSNLETELDSLKMKMRDLVVQTLEELNADAAKRIAGYDVRSDDDVFFIDHDELIGSIRMRKEAKSQNNKMKESWNRTLRILNHIIVTKGVDFGKYVHAVYGYLVRYKPPRHVVTNGLLNPQFEALHECFNVATNQLNNLRYTMKKEKEEAEQRLATLIRQKFQIDQVGRYYKKWSSLTPDKKEERVKSYCDWYVRKNDKPIDLSEKMKNFVMEKLESKDLRIMNIKWEHDLGVITNINVTVNDDNSFELGKRAPRILKSTKKTSKKKRDELFQTVAERKLMQRTNRLLLFELIKGQTLNKEIVLSTVLHNLHTRMIHENNMMDYLSATYDTMLDVIRKNLTASS